MPKYKVNGRTFNIPDNEVDLFEADFPEAQLHYQTNDGKKFTIYANERKDFLSDFPDATELGWSETIKEQAKQADPFQLEDNLAQPMYGSMSYQDNIGKPEDNLYYPSPLSEEGRADYEPITAEERSKQEYEMLMRHLDEFNAANGDMMDTYEAYEKAARHQVNEGGFAIDTPERRYLDENNEVYHARKEWRDDLNERIKNNSYFNQMRMAEADAANETVDAISNLMAQNEAENTELHKKMKAMNALAMNPRNSFSGFAKTKEMQEYIDERADLETAKRLYENTAQVYAAPINDREDILKKFGKGFGQRVDDADFWSMGIVSIADDMNARAAFQKIQDKFGSVKEFANLTDAEIDALLTPSEQLLISAVMDNNAALYARKDNTAGAYEAGAGAADSLMFMAQFLLTGGIGDAATVGTVAHRRLLNWLGRKVGSMSNGLMKNVARGAVKLGVGTAESIGKALVMTPLMPHTYANIADNIMSFDDKGELMDVTDAILTGAADALIETWSESTGDFVNKVLGVPGDITKGIAKKALKNVDFSNWGRMANAPIMKILRKGGFNGFLGEMGEEFIGNAVRSISGLEPDAFKEFTKLENLLVTAGSFAPMTIFGLGVSGVQYGWQKRKLDNAQKAFEAMLREASYTEDQARFVIDELLGSTDAHLTPEKLVANFSPLLRELAFNDKFANNRTQALNSAIDLMWQIARYRTFDGVYHRQEEQQRNDMLAEIQEGTGREFWTTRLSENVGLDGTAYEADEVRAVEFNDGRVAYVLGGDGVYNTVVYNDGQTGFLSEEQLNEGKAHGSIVSDATMGLNDYLTQQVARVRMTEEEQRMFTERNTNIGQVRAQFPIDATVELGTTEAPIQGVVRQQTPNGVIVESPAGISQLTWEELGHTIGVEINPQTDAQMEEEAINNLEIADLQRRRAREQRRAQRNAAAEAVLTEEQMVDEAENEGLEKPIPMKADGTVDQTAFWNESPARWAQWKTEQRQDGGAYASTYIQNAIGILEGQIAESEAAFLAESDFDAKDALEQTINQQRQRLAELQDLALQYMPAVIPAETSAEATAEQNQPSSETSQPAVMADRQKFELDAEYQRRLSLAKTLAEKEMILKEYFESISAGSMEAVVMNKQNYKQVMKDNGCDENAIERVAKSIKIAEDVGQAVSALHVNDKIFVIADYNYTVEQGRVSYVHERQHNITKSNPELIQRVLSLGLSRETLQKIVRTLSGTTFYDNESDEVLADEILSSTMEIAYTFDDFSVTLSKLGLPIELINVLNEINDEQRNDFTLANARRNAIQYDNPQGDSGQNVRDQGEVSGGILGEEGDGSLGDSNRRAESGESTTRGAEASEEGLQVPVAEVEEESEIDPETILNEDGFEVDEQNEDIRFSVRYLPTEEQRGQLIDSIVEITGRPRDVAERWLNSELSLAAIVLNDKEYLDYAPDAKYKAIKDNSDYPQGTVDFNNICRKRKDFTRMYTRLQRAYPNRIFTAENLADIRTVMSEDGLTVACGLCYVEDRRQKLGEVADEFIKDLQDGFKTYGKKNATKRANAEKFASLVGEDTYVPSIYDLITLEGSDRLHDEHRGIWEAFGAYNRARGQQTQNTFQGYAEYKREILTWSDAKVKKVNSLGGLRIFSYSDFEAHHLLDIIQIIIDCAARGVMIQGYTKVPEFARVVEKTGIKLNRSLIPLGDTGIVDGKLAYDPVEGIDINDPNFLESNDNIGNILIGINDEQIRMAMLDPFIHYIIPYHARQAANIRAKLNVGAWVNYMDTQNERNISDGKRVEKNINIYTDVLNESITNDREFVEKYLEVCRQKGFIPKFDQFLDRDAEGNYVYTPGYYKFLVDFKLFDEQGNILPQKPVIAEFDDAFNAQILADYAKEQRETTGEQLNSTYDKIVDTLDLGEPEGMNVKFGETVGPIDLIEEAKKAQAKHEDGVAFRVISQENYDMAQRMINNLAGDTYFRRLEGEYELGKLASNYAELADIIMAIDANRDYTPVGSAILGFFAENPDMHFPLLFNDSKLSKEAAKAFAEELSKVNDQYALFFMKEAWRVHKKSLGQAGLGVKDSSTTKFNKLIDARAEEIKAAEVQGTAFNFKKQESSLDEIDAIFKQLNKDHELAALHERVMSVAKTLGIKVSFAGKRGTTAGESLGDKVSYDYKFFNSPAISDQKKCNTITHELIHSVTVYAIYLRSKAPSVLSEGMIEAVDILHDVYNQIARDPAFKGEYGVSDVYEMVAELSNAQFRDKLKEKSLFQRILDALKKLLGINAVKEDSAHQVLSDTLDYIIDNYDQAAFDAYALYASRNKSYGRMMKIEEVPTIQSVNNAAATIKRWLNNNTRGRSFSLALPIQTLSAIKSKLGRDYDSHNITANGIAHALNNHGEAGLKLSENSIPITKENAELIPYIMVAPDYVEKGSTDVSGRESIKFFKELSNGYVVVVEKEYKNSPDDMETINMWAEMSSKATNAQQNAAPDMYVQNAILSTDVAKIRKDAEDAIALDNELRGIAPQPHKSNSFRITPEQDKAYMDAVERGDMETAQRMVNETAIAAGYTIRGDHGRVSKFTIFDRSKANPEGNWGQGFYFSNNEEDVENNYATVDSPDLEVKIEREVERRVNLAEMNEDFNEDGEVDEFAIREAVEKEFITSEPNVVHAAIKMDNPFVVGHGMVEIDEDGLGHYDMEETYLTAEYKTDEDGEIDYDVEPTGTLVDLVEALNDELSEYEGVTINAYEILSNNIDGMTASQFEREARELLENSMDYLLNDDLAIMTSEIIRAAIERAGFDGIVDNTVDQKFGTARRFGRSMDGMNADTRHYIAFQSSQIKQTDPVTYDNEGNVIPLSERFSSESEDIRFRVRSKDESAQDYHRSVLDHYQTEHNLIVPTTVVDINDRKALASALDRTDEEFTDDMYQEILDGFNEGGKSFYDPEKKRIAIFVIEDALRSADVEENIYHESTHALIGKNPELLELGEWLWNNADSGVRKTVKADIISQNYPEYQQANEMLSRFAGAVLAIGRAGEVYGIIPSEQTKNWDYILNELGYEPERHDGDRKLRHKSDTRRAGILREGIQKEVPDNGTAEKGEVRFRTIEITPEVQDEMDAIHASALVMGNFMKAPNGKDTNLTEEQWLMVRTKSFKSWFGDWENDPENASKVVDENGEPKVVYHGSPNEFNAFDEDMIGENTDSGFYGRGFYFATTEEESRGYGKYVIPAFLSMQNPLDLNELYAISDKWDGATADGAVRWWYGLASLFPNDAISETVYASIGGEDWTIMDLKNRIDELAETSETPFADAAEEFGIDEDFFDMMGEEDVNLPDELTDALKTNGYDGVINAGVENNELVALYPNQIKSTTDNTGEFSSEDNDIRFRIRTKPAPEKTGIGYKVFYLKDGKLYPPMVANLGGVDTPVNVWLDAEEGVSAGQSKTGRPKVKAGGKGTQGGSGTLAYRPGWHLGDIPYALQFNRKDENGEKTLFPADFVWAEVEYANDVDYQEEAMSYGYNANGNFQHSLAGLPKLPVDGSYRYRTNPNPETDPWIITGAMKVNRLLTPSEVDKMVEAAGREPQKRQEGAVTDEQINALNEELGLATPESEIRFRITGTPTEEVVAEDVNLSKKDLANLAGDIFAALDEDIRKKITDDLNGNLLGLQDAILQIPTSLATKEEWSDEDKATAEVIAEQMTKAVGKEMTRPFSASEALWTLYNAANKSTDLVSEASRALVRRNLGFDTQTLEMEKGASDGVRFRTVGDASANANASMYNRGAANVRTRLKESFVDMNASVEKLVKAIEKRSGKVAQGFENILLALNQQSSKGLAAMEAYVQKFLNRMFAEIREIMDKTDFKYEDIVRYVILKHGLERNVKMAQRDAKAHYQEIYDDLIAKITGMNAAQKRTYLTNAQLRDADAKAEMARLQAVNTSGLTSDQLRDHKKEIAKAKKEAADAAEHLAKAQKIATMTEQDALDELDKIFKKIEKGTDSVYKELRKNDYSGISSMFYDTLGVNRKDYETEEEYQAALMQAKADKYDSLGDIEGAAQMEVTLFENSVNTDGLWKSINKATKETLRQQYEANMISKDQYDSLRDMFEFYVPLRGFKDNTAEDMYTYYRKPNSTGYTKPILSAEGRKTEAESPFGWIAAMAGSAIASNVKNEAKLALYYFVSNRPDNGIATLSRTWFVHTPGDVDANGKKVFRPAYPPFNEDLSTDAAKQAYEDWQEQMRDLQKQGLAYEAGQRLNLGNSVVNISDTNKPEHIVNVKVGGKDYTIVINGNPRAAQAINGDLNIEATDQDYSSVFGPLLRWMSSVNTSYNPEFWITNMMRDMAFTMMAVNIKEDPAYRRKFSKNYAKAFKVIGMVAKNEKGTIGNSYLEQQYKDFVKYGGVTGYTQIKDSETWEKEIANYLASNDPASLRNGKIMRGMKSAFHAVHRFGESLEQVSRFAAFLTAVETGKSISEAINDAKEITVNFNRKGSGKMITLEEAKYLTDRNGQPLSKFEQWAAVGLSSIAPLGRRFIMFFNAAIQGLNATYKLYAKNKTRAIGWALGYAAIGIMNAALHAMLDDDDDYLDIPQYERRNSLMIGGNGAYFKWALPQEARAFYALGDLAVESIMGRNPHQNAVGEALKISTEILPINPLGGWKEFMPSVAVPLVELALNEDYKGDPVYNEQKWLTKEERERSANWSKAYPGTGKIYIGLAKAFNAATGGDEHDAGLVNLQPEKIEHIVQSAFGGTIRTADKFVNSIMAAINPEESVTVRQLPFLNRILTMNDERFKNVHVNDVYDYYAAEAEHAITLQKKYIKDRDKESLQELQKSDEYKWAQIYSKYKKPIRKYQEAIKVADTTAERMRLMKLQDELRRKMIKEISEL